MIIESIINFIQSIIFTIFLINCFEVKENGIKKSGVYVMGVFITFVYLGLPEVFWIRSMSVLYIPLAVIFCHMFLKGNILEQTLYCIIMLAVVAFISFFVLGITNIKGYSAVTSQVLSQIGIAVSLGFLAFIKKKIAGIFDKRYTCVFMMIPVLSIFVCSIIMDIAEGTRAEYVKAVISITCIALLNYVNLYLFIKLHNFYNNNILASVELENHRKRAKDIEAMKKIHIEVKKLNHEIQRIIQMARELLKKGEINKAICYLEEFENSKLDCVKNRFISENVILDSVFNQKFEECVQHKISTSCIVTGEIQGIKDIDLHILLGNLIDNAIEATRCSDEKRLEISIHTDENYIIIDIGNTVSNDVEFDIHHMVTTKLNQSMHGFGIANVKSIVEKYDGNMVYKLLQKNFIRCTVILRKDSVSS